ncbi:MAG: DUF86 domain-containing protein [Desulfurococcales archaeon]|nr:DUF86 domain-containing protein [Desulfurococcales archaeon]
MGALERLATMVMEMTGKLDALADMGLRGWVEELAALHALQIQAQALLDMIMRIASRLGYAPETPSEAARLLADEGLITREELELVRRVIGFRNIVVHEYTAVDINLVKRILEERAYRRLATLAAKLLEEAKRKNLDP